MKNKKKICAFIGSRANYGSLKSAMLSIKSHPDLDLVVVAAASSLLDKDGRVKDIMEQDGFVINEEVYMLLGGETPLTMAKSTGLGIVETATILERHKPDFIIVVGDRFEVMSFVIAAAYMNIPIAHTMGGEVTGTIDERIRHAITKFSHVHFVASADASQRVQKLGEEKDFIFNVGCPRVDIAKEVLEAKHQFDLHSLSQLGVGYDIDLKEDFLLVSQHPVTTEFNSAAEQVSATLQAVDDIGMPAIWLWPNADAGSSDISKQLRIWREKGRANLIRFVKNFDAESYMYLMSKASCLIGNSSSGIREGAFIGTPVVNIGTRQNARERASNVIDVPNDHKAIVQAVKKQIAHGRYNSEHLYGAGDAGENVARILANIDFVNVQKTISY